MTQQKEGKETAYERKENADAQEKAQGHPIHVISLGAGVQSSTMALMAAHGEITPMPKCAVFADTQDEPASVYKWLEWLEKELPFPVHRVTAGKLSDAALQIQTSKDGNKYTPVALPVYTLKQDGHKGMAMRQCTQNYKIIPLRRFCRQFKKQGVIQWIGISWEEIYRMKPSRDKWCVNRWPLAELKVRRHQCLEWMLSHGYPKPPRSACRYCPYHGDKEWLDLKQNQPEEFASAVAFEKQLQDTFTKITFANGNTPFLHNSRIPLGEADFSSDEDRGQLTMFANDCAGMCGV